MSEPLHENVARDNDREMYDKVPRHVWSYAQDQADLSDAAREIRRYLEELAVGASIEIYAIDSRAKSLLSYQGKSAKKTADGLPEYPNPATDIKDCVAARVIVFTTSARDLLGDLIERRSSVHERQNPGDRKHNGYDSDHLVITGIGKSEAPRYAALGRYFKKYGGLEIQIRSVAGHAWAEYEHDVRYKPGAFQDLSEDKKRQIDQWFVEAGGMRRVMDELFAKVQGLLTQEEDIAVRAGGDTQGRDTEAEFVDDLDPRLLGEEPRGEIRLLDAETLSELITTRFPTHERGGIQEIGQLLEHLQSLNLTTVGQLEVALAHVEEGQVERLMDYPRETAGVRRLDDELLAFFTEHYVETATGEDRTQFLGLRLLRVRGKFAIYSVEQGVDTTRLITAANTVRVLVGIVAEIVGLDNIEVEGAVALNWEDLLSSANARPLYIDGREVYVAMNFTRAWAESVMRQLVEKVPGSGLRVIRAGDLLVKAPDSLLGADGAQAN